MENVICDIGNVNILKSSKLLKLSIFIEFRYSQTIIFWKEKQKSFCLKTFIRLSALVKNHIRVILFKSGAWFNGWHCFFFLLTLFKERNDVLFGLKIWGIWKQWLLEERDWECLAFCLYASPLLSDVGSRFGIRWWCQIMTRQNLIWVAKAGI